MAAVAAKVEKAAKQVVRPAKVNKDDDTAEVEKALKLPPGQTSVQVELTDVDYSVSRTIQVQVPAGVTLKITGAKDKWTTIYAKGKDFRCASSLSTSLKPR